MSVLESTPGMAVLQLRIRPRVVLVGGVAVALTLAVLGFTVHVGQLDVPQEAARLSLLDLDAEGSIGTWLSTGGLLVAALGMLEIARRPVAAGWRRHWRVLALVFVALSADEAISIHEATIGPLRRVLDTGGVLFYAWVIPAAIGLLVLALAYRRFLLALPRPLRTGVLSAAALYVGGALGLELAGGWVVDELGKRTVQFLALATVEETLEMLGITVLVWALARALAPVQPSTTEPAPERPLRRDHSLV